MSNMSTLQEDFVTVNGVKLHCVTSGRGGNKLILFLHGFPEFWYTWRRQLEEFGTDYYAVAPDMRGYNLSDKPMSVADYEMDQLVADVKGLIDQLGGGKAILVAHDWGGGVAWNFAIRHPECLEKLIIINAPHPVTFMMQLIRNPAQRKASSYMLLFASGFGELALRANNFARLKAAVFEKSAKPAAFSDIDRQAYVDAWSQPGALNGGLSYYRAFVLQILRRLFKKRTKIDEFVVKVPTLVIWGEQDTALLPGNLQGLEELISDLQIKRIADGTHWVIHEEPELINTYIRQFIS